MRSRSWALAALVLAGACTPTSSSTSGTPATSAPPPQTTSSTADTTIATATTLPPGTEALPESLRRQIAELIAVTEEIRGLTFQEPPKVTVVSAEELAERVRAQVKEDLDTVEEDEALYRLLGLFPADADLLTLLLDLYGEQVGGYYDGEIGELVVPVREETFSPLQEATLVHELTHALTDQHFEFQQRLTDLIDADSFDEATALQALIEGDATLAEILYVQDLPTARQQEFLEETFGTESDVFQSAPLFLQQSLLFPYSEGLGFVQGLFESGGFQRVDQAYGDPPLSSEQIIDPFAYGRDEPREVALPALTLDDYELVYESTWGELGFRLMFDQVLGGDEDASAGWGGDRFGLYSNGAEVVFLLAYEGDRPDDATELAGALAEYIPTGMAAGTGSSAGDGRLYEGDDYAFYSVANDGLVLVAASDPAAGPPARAALAG